MNKYLALPLIALAAGCVAGEPVELSAAERSELSVALAGRVAGPTVSCVNLREIRGNRSIGEGAILFEGVGDTVYVNRPPAGCPDLRETRTLMTRTTTGRLCSGDIATVSDLTSGIQFGSCGLGGFTPYRRVR